MKENNPEIMTLVHELIAKLLANRLVEANKTISLLLD